MTNTPNRPSAYEPRKPVLPKPVNIRSNNSSPYDASGKSKSQ